jgi:hypothetical protein
MSQPPPPGPMTQPPGPGDPYGGQPPGERSKGTLVAIVVAVAVVIGGGVVALILLLGGDGESNEPSTASPLDTAESFGQSWNLTDTRTLKSLMTDDLRPFANFDESDMDQIELENPEVIEERGARAVAELEGGDNTYQLFLVRQEGEWLIQEINIDTMS